MVKSPRRPIALVASILSVFMAVMIAMPGVALASDAVTSPTPLVPGKATVSGLAIASTIDGTDFTTTDGPGLDSSGSNNICRTFDTVTYTLSYATALKTSVGEVPPAGYTEGDLYFKATIPSCTLAEAQFDVDSMSWATDVEQKQVGSDVVLTGKRHLTNGSLPTAIPGAGTLSIPLLVKASYQGQTYTPEFSVWLDGDAASGTKSVTAKQFTVSSTPTMNVALSKASTGKAYAEGVTSSKGTALGNGIVQDITASIQVGSTDSAKGSEAPSGPVTFTLNLSGKHTAGGATTDTAAPRIAYVEDASGKATTSYVDNGDGTATVTVSGYDIPELTASTSTPIDIVDLKVGVFQEQPQTIPNNEKYEITVTDTNLVAKGVSGTDLPAATEGTNDNQSVTTDDYVNQAFEMLRGSWYVGCCASSYLEDDDYYKVTLGNKVSNALIWGHDDEEYYPGQTIYTCAKTDPQPGHSPFTSEANAITGGDFLIKIDGNVLTLPDTDEWGVVLSGADQSSIDNCKVTIRYAAKPDGSGWTGYEEANNTSMREMVFYDSREELKAAGATCLGVLMEVRDVSYYNDVSIRTGITPYYAFQVKNDRSLIDEDAVGWCVYNSRLYSSGLYTPSSDTHAEVAAKEKAYVEYSAGDSDSNYSRVQVRNGFAPVGHDENGNRTSGTGEAFLGNSFYVSGFAATVDYTIETKDDGGAAKTVYNVSNGDQQIDFKVQPNISASKDDPVSVRYIVRLSDKSPYVEGSAFLNGQAITWTKVTHNSAKGYSTYFYDVPSIRPSQVTALTFSASIDSSAVSNGEDISTRVWLYTGDEGSTAATNNGGHVLSYSVVKVGDIRFSKTVETDDSTGATGTKASAKNGLTYHLGMDNTSAVDITDMKVLDVLPYNGDTLGTDYTGAYSVKRVTLDTGGASVSSNGLKLYYTTSNTVQSSSYNAGSVDVGDGTWVEAANVGTDTDPAYDVATDSTALVLVGTMPVGTGYALSIPFDTTHCLGCLGNGATVYSPDIAGDTHTVSVNSTETEVIHAVNVTNTLTGLVTDNKAKTTPTGSDYEETLTARDGYELPRTISVTVGGTELTPAADPSNPQAGEYVYDSSTGKVSVPGASVTDDIVVVAVGTPVHDLTNVLTSIVTDKPVSQKVTEGTDYEETLTATTGHELPDTITVNIGGTDHVVTSGTTSDGISYDKATGKVTVDGDSITGDVTVTATAVATPCTVRFATEAGGTISGDDPQTVGYGDSASAGATATAESGHTFLGWTYDYVGLDGKTHSGTTTDYTTVPVLGDVTFTATYAADGSVAATADHGSVSTSASTTPAAVGTSSTSTTVLASTTGGANPTAVAFAADDNYHVSTIKVRDSSGNVVATLDPTLTTPQTITVGSTTTTVTVTTGADGKTGSIVSEDQKASLLVYDVSLVPDEHSLTNVLTGLTSDKGGTQTVTYGTDYTETLTPAYESGKTYQLPDTITVTVGGTSLKQANDPRNPQPGEFGYDPTTGKVTIGGGEITGDVVITAAADFSVTNDLTNLVTDNDATKVSMGETYTETLTPEDGYRRPDSVTVTVAGVEHVVASGATVDGISYDKATGKVTVDGAHVTGDIHVVAEAVRTAVVTDDVTDGHISIADGTVVDQGVDLTTTIKPDDGYKLPDTVTVTIGGVDHVVTSGTPTADGITYDSSTGELFVPGDLVDGDVTITATCVRKPAEPTTPTNPTSPDAGGTSDAGSSVTPAVIPATGDPTQIEFLGLALVAAVAIVVGVVSRRKGRA